MYTYVPIIDSSIIEWCTLWTEEEITKIVPALPNQRSLIQLLTQLIFEQDKWWNSAYWDMECKQTILRKLAWSIANLRDSFQQYLLKIYGFYAAATQSIIFISLEREKLSLLKIQLNTVSSTKLTYTTTAVIHNCYDLTVILAIYCLFNELSLCFIHYKPARVRKIAEVRKPLLCSQITTHLLPLWYYKLPDPTFSTWKDTPGWKKLSEFRKFTHSTHGNLVYINILMKQLV